MKKKLLNISNIVLGFFMALVCLLPIFGKMGKDVVAEESAEPVKYRLISPTYNSDPSLTLSKYNIATAQTSTITPFDTEIRQRKEGMAFNFEMDDRNQITDNADTLDRKENVVTVDRIENISESEQLSLFMWINFDQIAVHNLSITLTLENGSSLNWAIGQTELAQMLTTSELQLAQLPYGWNRFEFKFSEATTAGELYESGVLSPVASMQVNYESQLVITSSFAKLRFYDVYLSESTEATSFVVEQLEFRDADFYFFEQEVIDGVCVGDSVTLPAKNDAILFAYNGDINLKTTTSNNIVWRVLVKDPNEEITTTTFGTQINLTQEGDYYIYYQCIDNSQELSEPIVSQRVKLSVNVLNAVFIGNTDVDLEVGKTYVFNVRTNSMFTEIQDLQFISSSDNFEVAYSDGSLYVTAHEEGDYTVTAKVTASRAIKVAATEYSSEFSFTAEEPVGDKYAVVKIVLWVILGIFGVVVLVFGIKMLVKANKYDVK